MCARPAGNPIRADSSSMRMSSRTRRIPNVSRECECKFHQIQDSLYKGAPSMLWNHYSPFHFPSIYSVSLRGVRPEVVAEEAAAAFRGDGPQG